MWPGRAGGSCGRVQALPPQAARPTSRAAVYTRHCLSIGGRAASCVARPCRRLPGCAAQAHRSASSERDELEGWRRAGDDAWVFQPGQHDGTIPVHNVQRTQNGMHDAAVALGRMQLGCRP
jgi:hypothetical protein